MRNYFSLLTVGFLMCAFPDLEKLTIRPAVESMTTDQESQEDDIFKNFMSDLETANIDLAALDRP